MENWSKPFSNYDGEEKIRLIYATRKDKKQYIFETTQEIILPADKTYEYEWHEWDLHKKIRTLKVVRQTTAAERGLKTYLTQYKA